MNMRFSTLCNSIFENVCLELSHCRQRTLKMQMYPYYYHSVPKLNSSFNGQFFKVSKLYSWLNLLRNQKALHTFFPFFWQHKIKILGCRRCRDPRCKHEYLDSPWFDKKAKILRKCQLKMMVMKVTDIYKQEIVDTRAYNKLIVAIFHL